MGLRELDLALYAASALAELAGVLITIMDLTSASSRLQKFLTDEPPFIVTATAKSRSSVSATASGGSVPAPERRLAALEAWKASELPKELDQLDEELRRLISSITQNTYDTFMGRWRHLKKYLRFGHQRWYRRYLGPIVVGAGIAVGFVANAVNIYGLSASSPHP